MCAIQFLSAAVPCDCPTPVVACGSNLEVQGGSKGGVKGANFFNIKKKCAFSTNTQSSFASDVFDSVLGPPCLARHPRQSDFCESKFTES